MTFRHALVGLLVGGSCAAFSANEIGYIETFSLSEDRAKALEQLIPGTPDYYYYHCLHYQNTGNRAQYDKFLQQFIKRHRYTARVNELRYRQALIDYETNPKASLEFIRSELGLHFDHRKKTDNQKSSAPTSLDQNLISVQTLMDRAFREHKNLHQFEPEGLELLSALNINADQRRDLLSRLQRPDYPGLVDLIVADLKYKHSGGFGSHTIHQALLRTQLDELLSKMPELRNQDRFVSTYLLRLRPGNDVDLDRNTAEREAYYERLWAFVNSLDPVHNSLKANVLYNRLEHDRRLGKYDHGRFMTYIQLPRAVAYANPKWIEKQPGKIRVNLNQRFNEVVLPPVGLEEPLVMDYLARFLKDAENYKPYEPYIRDTILKSLFATTKILNGIGDPEQWASLLSPSEYQALKDRIDLDFAHQNTRYFDPEAPVKLDVHVKNVKSLIIKLFEVNTLNYYRDKKQEVNLAINLDGLVAFHEEQRSFKDAPARRVKRTFEFPQIQQRGVYVVEFIGNGKSSRALVNKGRMHFLENLTPAGHALTILDEQNRQVVDATVWMQGREFTPNEAGTILIPFSTAPQREKVVIQRGRFASLAALSHQAENYQLSSGFYVDRETLLKRRKAQLLVKPVLQLNGLPVSLKLLEDVKLIIESTDADGVSSRKEVPDFELHEGRESIYEFQVPEKLISLQFSLVAKVQNISRNKKEDLSTASVFSLNGIDRTAGVDDLHITWENAAYTVEFLGKNGEVKPSRPLHVELKHRLFKPTVHVSLQTDAAGRCALGALKDITWFRVKGPEERQKQWYTSNNEVLLPESLHGIPGETLKMSWQLDWRIRDKDPLTQVSLLGIQAGQFVTNWHDALQIKNGFLEINGLPAGDYDLYIKPLRQKINLRITAGEKAHRYALSGTRALQLEQANPLTISKVTLPEKGEAEIHLAHATPHTRVHIISARYLPEYPLFSHLSFTGFPGPQRKSLSYPQSLYESGRKIGDEHRYILDRRYAEKYPGLMLQRPGLLLNPWAIRKTDAGQEQLLGGTSYGGGAAAMAGEGRAGRMSGYGGKAEGGNYANLDFLQNQSVVLANLKPDADGVVRFSMDALGEEAHIRILAVDPRNSISRMESRPGAERQSRELRLVLGMDPAKHFGEEKLISVAPAGQPFILADVTTSDMENFDTLAKVFKLYATLSGNDTLNEFAFIQNWPKLDPEEQQKKYAKYACHELSFFLFHKDPDFFARIIKPYLANKKDKTFMDHWLLGHDLAGYLEPWAFARLNMVERILLGRNLKQQHPSLARHVEDLNDLIPPDIERFNHLFDTALQSSALETGEGFASFAMDAIEELEMEESADIMVATESLVMDARDAKGAFKEASGSRRALAARVASAAPQSAFAKSKKLSEKNEISATPVLNAERQVAEDDAFFGDFEQERKAQRRFFQKLEQTEELVENNYYHLPIEAQVGSLITVNNFWKDYAAHDGKSVFLSRNLAEASRNFPEMMLALAVLDLPFEAAEHAVVTEKVTYQVTPAHPVVMFHKEIREGEVSNERTPILVSQVYFRADDRYRHEGNERFQKYVTKEFLQQVVYGCQVVLTNPTENRQKLSMLLQIPRGALPVSNGFYTQGKNVVLEPYATTTLDYYYYFPATGRYPQYPVHVSKNEELVAFADPFVFNVVEKLSQVDTTSWAYVSQHGSNEEVIEFLNTHNMARIDLAEIAWRMKDKDYFQQVTTLVHQRHFYNNVLWSYGLYHDVLPVSRTFLKHSNYAERVGNYIDTPLLTVDPVERHTYQHMEYAPLVNPRAHQVGKDRTILNHRFREQYQRFMKVLSYRQPLDDADRLGVTYYLLLQDRAGEGLDWFGRVDAGKLPTRLQYDYMKVCAHVLKGELEPARKLAKAYATYPVPSWQKKFVNALNQLDEGAGAASAVADAEDRSQAQDNLAATEPSLELKVEAQKIELTYRNLETCEINYYPMDLELLFSRNPFIQQQSAQFSFIRPVETETVALPKGKDVYAHTLPAKFRSSNVMVEIVAGGIRRSQAYYANALSVQVIENYGQVQVLRKDNRAPLSTVYVKVYARMQNGQVKFFKDGYTDFRGRFDYISLNSNELEQAERFSLLIMSEEHGAVIREAAPPKR